MCFHFFHVYSTLFLTHCSLHIVLRFDCFSFFFFKYNKYNIVKADIGAAAGLAIQPTLGDERERVLCWHNDFGEAISSVQLMQDLPSKKQRGIDTIFEAKKKSLDNTDGNKQKNDSIYIYNIQSSQRGYKFISPPKPSILTSFEKATNERVSCPDSATSKPSGSFFLMGSSFYLNTYRDGWGLGGGYRAHCRHSSWTTHIYSTQTRAGS